MNTPKKAFHGFYLQVNHTGHRVRRQHALNALALELPDLPETGLHRMGRPDDYPIILAKAHYNQQRAQGRPHQAAIRWLAYKWIRILHCCSG